jgi:hypothetical protein
MEILGIDLASLPWPIALLIGILALISVFVFYVYLPLLDEVNRLKDEQNSKLDNIIEILAKLDIDLHNDLIKTISDLNLDRDILTKLDVLQNSNAHNFSEISDIIQHVLNNTTELVRDLDELVVDFKEHMNKLTNIQNKNENHYDYIKETLTRYSSQIENVKDKINNITIALSPRLNYNTLPGFNPSPYNNDPNHPNNDRGHG